MQIGAVLPHNEIGTDPGAIKAYLQGVEDLGMTHLLIYDHVMGADPNRLLHDIHRVVLAQQEEYGGIIGGLIEELRSEASAIRTSRGRDAMPPALSDGADLAGLAVAET